MDAALAFEPQDTAESRTERWERKDVTGWRVGQAAC